MVICRSSKNQQSSKCEPDFGLHHLTPHMLLCQWAFCFHVRFEGRGRKLGEGIQADFFIGEWKWEAALPASDLIVWLLPGLQSYQVCVSDNGSEKGLGSGSGFYLWGKPNAWWWRAQSSNSESCHIQQWSKYITSFFLHEVEITTTTNYWVGTIFQAL